MGRLDGFVALITGAASPRCQGAAEARLFAAEGAQVVLTDVVDDEGERTAAAIGTVAIYRHLDVTSDESWQSVVEEVCAAHGRLDVLVNNAGIAYVGNIEDADMQQWRHTMAVNADGVFLGCKHGVALMKKGGRGSIINLSSIDGIIGEADLAAYCASKGAVRTLTKSVAVHCAERKYGIRCNSIHPGYIWTPQTENYLRDLGKLDEEQAKALSRHPIGFLGEPDDIAYMVLYLASDESKFVTGSEMVVDGGYLMV